MGGFGIVIIFCRYRTFVSLFFTAVADIRSSFNLLALFTFKVVTHLIADMARAACSITESEFLNDEVIIDSGFHLRDEVYLNEGETEQSCALFGTSDMIFYMYRKEREEII